MKNIINKLLLIIILFKCSFSMSQLDSLILLSKADSIENLIPSNWKLLSTTNGDLNNDGLKDVVFVIEKTDKQNIQLNKEGLGRDTINTNPRVLGIYFGDKSGRLIKQLQSNHFIILQDSPTMDEPFDGIQIREDGLLKIDFKFWYSAGSWSMSNHSYTFKFQNRNFDLIHYEATERHRGTGDETEYDIDFLNGNMTTTRITFDDNNKKTVTEERSEFELEQFKSLESLQKPFEWEFNGVLL